MLNTYVYQARDAAGEPSWGEMAAENEREAAKLLMAQGLFPTSMKLRTAQSGLVKVLLRYLLHGKYVMFFCRELAAVIGAGMTVNDALQLLAAEEQGKKERTLLQSMAAKVQSGSTLAATLHEHEEYFSETVWTMVAVGEQSGSLSEILQRLVKQLEKDYAAREKLVTIMLYPLILCAVTLVTIGIMVSVVLPVFAGFFTEMHAELPLITKVVLAGSNFLLNYGVVMLPLVLLCLVLVGALLGQEHIRLAGEKLFLRLPVLGRLWMYTELARFAGTLSILLGSGMVIDQALELLQEITGSLYLRLGIRRACEDVRRGWPLSRSLRRLEVIPSLELGLLQAGEETGTLEEMLQELAKFAGQQADKLIERLKIVLPVLLLLALSIVAGAVIFAIALPILDTMLLLSY